MKKRPEELSSSRMNQLESMPPRKKKRRGKRLKQLLGLTVLTVAGVLAYDGYSALHFFQVVNKGNHASAASAESWTGTDRVNILLLGIDNRGHDSNPRSDSMIVASIDPVSKSVDLISIMRDTIVPIPGYGKDKINAADADGGPQLAIQTVKNFLGIPIQYYVQTDFQGFEGVIDAVGGVDFNVEKDMDYADDGVYDIHLKKGMQHLDGKHALMYVRFRHDEMSDFSRTERQRNLLKAVFSKIKNPTLFFRLPAILQASEKYVQTDIQPQDALRLSNLMRNVDMSNLKTLQLPPMNGISIQNDPALGDILVPDVQNTRNALQKLLTEGQHPADGQTQSQNENAAPAGAGSTAGPASAGSTAGASSQGQKATVTVSGVNVRQGPGTENSVLTVVNEGDSVTVLRTLNSSWDYVRLADGTEGYISAQFLSLQ